MSGVLILLLCVPSARSRNHCDIKDRDFIFIEPEYAMITVLAPLSPQVRKKRRLIMIKFLMADSPENSFLIKIYMQL